MPRSAAETRTLLIETAERLYAERGVNGVSLREIGAAAGQRNTGAVRYHFGDKRGLLSAVLAHRMAPANAHRLALLAAADAAGRGHDPRALVEALVLPLARSGTTTPEHREHSGWYVRFLAQVLGDAAATSVLAELRDEAWLSGAVEIERRVAALAPLPSAQLQTERWALLNGFVVHALADRAARRTPDADPAAAFVDHVVELGAAMLTAAGRGR